jgi:hypothetical protein
LRLDIPSRHRRAQARRYAKQHLRRAEVTAVEDYEQWQEEKARGVTGTGGAPPPFQMPRD